MRPFARNWLPRTIHEAKEESCRAKCLLAKNNFLDFVTYTKPDYDVSWHHEAICRELDALVRGETTRLILCAPPRHGKSEVVSRRFPAYVFGKDPDAEIIACSYNNDLAKRMNRDVQRIIDSPRYKGVFPDTTLYGKNIRSVAQGTYLRNSDIFEIVGHKGVYRSAGVGVGITGMGAKYAIIDDPFKDRKEANSQTIRRSVWDWYASTFYTRLAPDARILVINTRWHEDDLVGRLIERQKEEDGEQWRVVSFPALAEPDREDAHDADLANRREGDALWERRFNKKKLLRIKAVIGSYEWAALYQQRPSPAEGAIFLREWWRYYGEKPAEIAGRMQEIAQSWDASFKDGSDNSYVVGQVWGKRDADRYLLDQVRAHMDFPATVKAVMALKAKWGKTGRIYIEDKANGPAVISTLQRTIQGIIPVSPEGGKIVRAHAVTGQIESGNVFLPSVENAPWVGDFIEEAAAFPNSSFDDQIDAMSQALTQMAERDGMEDWRRLGLPD
ncbi:MAG: phage terminase large subunit [Synergistaceae bacterium]|jgi:predicted phage terminase large subunit-like protein|nr:phage terminase large subunit [Synergistaceae bacterium]